MAHTPFDLPESAAPLLESLESTHQLVEFAPGADPSLAYRLLLPKGWKAEGLLPGAAGGGFGSVQMIGLFAPEAASQAPFVTVGVSRIPVEVNLEDWCDFLCAQDGWEVFSSTWRKTPRGLAVDSGALRGRPPRRQVMRTLAFADGGRVFTVSGVAVEADWDGWKRHLLVALSSLELTSPSGHDSLEPLARWEGGEPGFGVAYPASWEAEARPSTIPGKSGLDIRLTDGDQLLGYLGVKSTDTAVHSGSNPEQLFAEAARELTTAGYLEKESFIAPVGDPLPAMIPGYEGTRISSGVLGSADVEIRVGCRMTPDRAFSVTLISVTQRANPLLWMRSKRAFELVCELNWKLTGAS